MKDKHSNGRSSTPSTSLISTSSSKKKSTKKKNVRQKNDVGFFQKVSAVITRLMFLLHTGLALWRVSLIYDTFYLYLLSIGVGLLLLEMVFTLAVRQGKEYKWFCPSVFFYLLSVVPCLWLLELARLDEYQKLPEVSGGCLPLPQLEDFNITAGEEVVLQINQDQKRSIPGFESSIDGNGEIVQINRKRRQANETSDRHNITQPTKTTIVFAPAENVTQTLQNSISIGTINNNDSLGTHPDHFIEQASGESGIPTTNTHTDPLTTVTLIDRTTAAGNQSQRSTASQLIINHVTTAIPQLRSTTDAFDIADNDVTAAGGDSTTRIGGNNVMRTKGDIATKITESDVTTVGGMTTAMNGNDITRPEGDVTTNFRGNDVTTHKTGIQNFGESITNFGENTLMLIQNTTITVNAFLNLLDPENWLLGLHQVLLFVLVIGRWLLPKGEISRDQLSQLLLVFIGVGADILEFVTETFGDEETSVKCNLFLHYVIYGVWSWSLLQFTLVLTAVKSRKERIGFSDTGRVPRVQNAENCFSRNFLKNADLWAILVTLLLQDVPFLVFRLYMMVVYNQVQQMMIFFTGKNILVVILQVYRIIVLQIEKKSDKIDEITDVELQPLRGTLNRLSAKARSFSPSETNADKDIKDATFKSKRDGSVVVKIHLHKQKSKQR